MTEAPVPSKTTLHCALELSKNTWLLAIQFPDRPQPSLYRIKGGDAGGLMAQLLMACERCAKTIGEMPTITICYEVGYDAFWLARFLIARSVECLVVDPASLQVKSSWAPCEDRSDRCRQRVSTKRMCGARTANVVG